MAKKPAVPAIKKPKVKPYPSAKVGSYRAPVDTTGMDPDMMETMGIKRKKAK